MKIGDYVFTKKGIPGIVVFVKGERCEVTILRMQEIEYGKPGQVFGTKMIVHEDVPGNIDDFEPIKKEKKP